MEIQQHDGVVVEVAGSRQGFAKLLREGEVLQGEREAPKAVFSLPLQYLSLLYMLDEALPASRYIHHHAVVLLDLHQPLLPPCWIKKEETSSPTVRVLNAEVPFVRRSVIGDLDHDEYDSINPVLLNASAHDLQGYVDALLSLVAR